MRYSVWNIGEGCFDYYDTPQQATSSNVEKPTHLVQRTLGATVEQAAWPLPSGAVLVGSGPHAEGRVAIHASMALAGDGGGGISTAKAALLLVAGAVAVKVLLPKKRRRR